MKLGEIVRVAQSGPRLMVVIPHSSRLVPPEVVNLLSKHTNAIMQDHTDWYSEHLYDFRGLLPCEVFRFPYSLVYVNPNRHPENEENVCEPVVELADGRKLPVYKQPVPVSLCQKLVEKYHQPFHETLRRAASSFTLALEGHTTTSRHRGEKGENVQAGIILIDRQQTKQDPPGGLQYAPPIVLKTYAAELAKQLPEVKIDQNKTYVTTYGHIPTTLHGLVPSILQETNEDLFKRGNIVDTSKVARLRKAFATAMAATMKTVGGEPGN